MRRFALAVVSLAFLFGNPNHLRAQDNPTSGEQGLKPYGSFHGGDIDSISMANTKLNLHIPLVSYPQRGGKLHVGFTVTYTAPVYTPLVDGGTGKPPVWFASYSEGLSGLSGTTVAIVPDFKPLVVCAPGNCPYYEIYEPDGSVHAMLGVGSGLVRSADATGYVYNPTTKVLTDRHGTRYTVASGTSYTIEDTNGNQITGTSTGWTDTVGRSIPTPRVGHPSTWRAFRFWLVVHSFDSPSTSWVLLDFQGAPSFASFERWGS
jgi:hypothetical protein